MKQIITKIRRHWMPLLGLNSILLAATIYAAFASTTIPSIWKANAELNIPQSSDQLNSSLGSLGNVQNVGLDFRNVNPLQIQLSILTSDIVLERVRKMDPEGDSYSRLNDYKQLFAVTPQEISTIISLEARASHPQLAADRLSSLIEVYQQRLNELRRNDANVREQFAQDELTKSRNNLTQIQRALASFQKSTGITDITEQSKGLIAAINELKTAQANAIAQAQANETQAQVAAANLGMTPAQALNSLRLGENKEYQSIRTKVSEVETALAEARGTYTDASPLVQSLLVKRQELRRILEQHRAKALPGGTSEPIDTTLGGNGGTDNRLEMIAELTRTRNAAKGLYQQASQIQVQIDKLSAQLNSITANQTQLSELQRRYEIAEGAYKGIIAQIQQTKTNPFSVYPNVQVLDQPTIDTKPLEPSQKLIVFGGLIAAIFGSIALVIFLENRNPMLRPKDLQQIELPVLGRISRLKRPNLEKNLEADIEIDFQRLASAILMAENNRLMITSATAGEGKTTVTLGLALALVNFGFRVLIVDGDLRQAEMSRRLGQLQTKQKASGLAPVSIAAGLDLLPAPPIPKAKVAKYFVGGSFEECLRPIADRNEYDYVLVDSPPISLASESTMMNASIRDVLFVVRSGKSDRHCVMDSLEQLNWHNARIMGLIVNSIDSLSEGYRYGKRELQESEEGERARALRRE